MKNTESLNSRGWVRPTKLTDQVVQVYIDLHGFGMVGYEQDYKAAYRGDAAAAARLDALADKLAMERLRGKR